jgi:GT2 family glycosyltransferase
MYDFCVIISSYKRESMLKLLLDNIFLQKKKYKFLVIVFDDGSIPMYDLSKYDIKYIRFYKNNGKRGFWNLVNTAFSYCKNISSKKFIFIGDDMRLCKNFFERADRLYESIKDQKKICLGLFIPDKYKRLSNWTNFIPIELKNIYHTQWNDVNFIAEYKFFKNLNFCIDPIPSKRFINNPNLSSGVGQQISVRLNNLGFNMYHAKKSLISHGDHESMMNPLERKQHKIIIKFNK